MPHKETSTATNAFVDRFRWTPRCLHAAFALVLMLWLATAASFVQAQPAENPQERTRQVWQLLDYIAADYAGAVKDGKIADKAEFNEMSEFAHTAHTQLQGLPESNAKASLLAAAGALQADIHDLKPAADVSKRARQLAASLLAAYPVPTAPAQPMHLADASRLYQANCAQCHGQAGDGKGPLAARMEPPPVAFTDRERAGHRSVFALYQAISKGVSGTSMPAFAALTENERWTLAFHVSTMAFSAADKEEGERLWKREEAARRAIPDLNALSRADETSLAETIGREKAGPVLAYLRGHPAAVTPTEAQHVQRAQAKLRESFDLVKQGDRPAALRTALSAYLDEFEAVEPALAARHRDLLVQIEANMAAYRNAIPKNEREQTAAAYHALDKSMAQAAAVLADTGDETTSTFLAALTVLLREGIEALLVVVGIIAFLKKAGRTDALPYVHAGWGGALLAGGATWFVATRMIAISGASRELTEGFSALFAAVVLIAVGVWMHRKSMAGRWQAYMRDKLSHALGKGSARLLFILAFVTVYREVFETILFYAAMWRPGNTAPLLGGFFSAVILLALIAAVMLRTSARLPIAKFFQFSAFLVAVLAVVLLGKGVAALQEAGVLELTPVALPRVDLLGIYPSTEGLVSQAVALAVILLGLSFNRVSSGPK